METIYRVIIQPKGIASNQLAKSIGVTQTTAWKMLHRIREMLKEYNVDVKLSGIVQADEAFIGGKNKNRHWDKKVKNSQGRSFKDKTPVLGLLQQEEYEYVERPHKKITGRTVRDKIITRRGRLFCKVIPDTKGKHIRPIVYQMVERGSILVSDEWQGYNGLDGTYQHEIVNHIAKQYVNEAGFTSNAVENRWSILKRMIIGTYHKVSRKYLQRYVDELVFRQNNRHLKGYELLAAAMQNCGR